VFMPNYEKHSPSPDNFEDFEREALEMELADLSELEAGAGNAGEDPAESEDSEEEAEEDGIQVALPELAGLPAGDSKAWRFKSTEEEITGLLKRGTFGGLKLIPWGSNYTFIAPLCDKQDGQEYAVIYKPVRGEAPLWDFPGGTLYKREYAAYLVSRALDWNFIPPVIIRDGPHGPGTVQLFVDVDEQLQYYTFRDRHTTEFKRIAIFDFITNNADRKMGHCLLGADGFVWGIDHGLCFNYEPKLRTIIWEFAGEPIPDDIYTDLLELATNGPRLHQLTNQLGELLSSREVKTFVSRLERVLQNPYFPNMSSRRQVPWGFF
jgi:hypothetical protein